MAFLQNYLLGRPVQVSSRIPKEQHLNLRRMRTAENILLTEFNVARAECDQVKETPQSPDQMQATCERYIEAVRRPRLFLGVGEIPPDVARQFE
jgi:hypothetical protein